jgi:acetate CoA/acetoacetate CoA-transferase alpha subunit
MLKNKMIRLEDALSRVRSGMSIAVGGFLNQGVPLTLIRALNAMDVDRLTICANDAGYGDRGIVELVRSGKVRQLIVSHVGYTPDVGAAAVAGDVEIVWTPQGTLIERMRAGGAGLGGVLTPTGLGTAVAEGKEVISVDGRDYLLEKPLRTDIAFVRAHVGDTWGNLQYRRTARNFNPVVATCADYVIAEVEHLCCVGELPPDHTHTSGLYVDAIVRATEFNLSAISDNGGRQ